MVITERCFPIHLICFFTISRYCCPLAPAFFGNISHVLIIFCCHIFFWQGWESLISHLAAVPSGDIHFVLTNSLKVEPPQSAEFFTNDCLHIFGEAIPSVHVKCIRFEVCLSCDQSEIYGVQLSPSPYDNRRTLMWIYHQSPSCSRPLEPLRMTPIRSPRRAA